MRPTKDAWAMALAAETAKRSTCLRRSVGCVLLNSRGHIIATGYNGVAAGLPHCNDVLRQPMLGTAVVFTSQPHACSGAGATSGTNLDGCQAIHAEQNALLQCRDVYEIATCVVTTSPCMTCTKLLLNTSCQVILFSDEYSHTAAADLWRSAGREWRQFK